MNTKGENSTILKKRHLGDQTNININNINEEHVSKLKVQIPELVRNILKTF